MRIEQSTRDGCTIITLTGHLDPALLERTLRNIKVLIESEVPKAS